MNKIVALFTVLVVLFAGIASAAENRDARDIFKSGLDFFENDARLMASLDTMPQMANKSYAYGYTDEAGKLLVGEHGGKMIFGKIGIQNVSKHTFSGFFYAWHELAKELTADDLRSMMVLMATIITEDAVNADSISYYKMMVASDYFASNSISADEVLYSLLNLQHMHPNGLVKQTAQLYRGLFTGNHQEALAALRDVNGSALLPDITDFFNEKEAERVASSTPAEPVVTVQ